MAVEKAHDCNDTTPPPSVLERMPTESLIGANFNSKSPTQVPRLAQTHTQALHRAQISIWIRRDEFAWPMLTGVFTFIAHSFSPHKRVDWKRLRYVNDSARLTSFKSVRHAAKEIIKYERAVWLSFEESPMVTMLTFSTRNFFLLTS